MQTRIKAIVALVALTAAAGASAWLKYRYGCKSAAGVQEEESMSDGGISTETESKDSSEVVQKYGILSLGESLHSDEEQNRVLYCMLTGQAPKKQKRSIAEIRKVVESKMRRQFEVQLHKLHEVQLPHTPLPIKMAFRQILIMCFNVPSSKAVKRLFKVLHLLRNCTVRHLYIYGLDLSGEEAEACMKDLLAAAADSAEARIGVASSLVMYIEKDEKRLYTHLFEFFRAGGAARSRNPSHSKISIVFEKEQNP